MPRRTRIVATLGPASESPETLRSILDAGVDVVRINFSHGTADDHIRRIKNLREIANTLRKPIAVLADLPGPKLRVRLSHPRAVNPGDILRFGFTGTPATSDEIVINAPECLREIKLRHRMFLDDGRIQLSVVKVESTYLEARVTSLTPLSEGMRSGNGGTPEPRSGGELLPNKGLNLPDTSINLPTLTQQDREALAVVAQTGVDWLALSFVRHPSAADELRAEAAKLGLNVPVIAKLERPEAVTHAKAIIEAFDGVMIARGDLGVEIPLEQVPMVQKRLIGFARAAGKPAITATDMLDSMRHNPRPTRAEASDVANAILDGTDAVMLSGETATGLYPVAAVSCMARIAEETESHASPAPLGTLTHRPSIDDLLTQTICELARDLGADAILTPSLSGRTARLVARHRPRAIIVAPASSDAVVRRLSLVWGVKALRLPPNPPVGEERLEASVRAAFVAGILEAGKRVIVFAGHPIEGRERLPTIRFVKVGEGGNSTEP